MTARFWILALVLVVATVGTALAGGVVSEKFGLLLGQAGLRATHALPAKLALGTRLKAQVLDGARFGALGFQGAQAGDLVDLTIVADDKPADERAPSAIRGKMVLTLGRTSQKLLIVSNGDGLLRADRAANARQIEGIIVQGSSRGILDSSREGIILQGGRTALGGGVGASGGCLLPKGPAGLGASSGR